MNPVVHDTTPPVWLTRGRIPALDGLRALAILLVLFSHVLHTHGFPFHPRRIYPVTERLGTLGVDVFFVLSGFLITTLLYRERDRTRGISLGAFYLRRVLRIAPAYVCFLLFVALLAATGRADINAGDWVAAGTYTMNFRAHPPWELGQLWSLSIEEHFYVLWPPLFAFLPRRSALAGLIGVLALEPVLRWAVLFAAPDYAPATEQWTFTRLDSIAAGCLLAVISRSDSGLRLLDRAARYWPAALATLLAALGAATVSGKVDVGVAPTVISAAIAILVWAAMRNEPRYLEARAVLTIGVASYSLYLWQEVFMNPRRGDWWNTFPQNVALTAVCAAISFRFIERPFLKLKARRARA